MKPIDLWEALTALEINHRREDCARGPEVTKDDLGELAAGERFYNQEISLEGGDNGWEIRVFSCEPECMGDEVKIFIPSDPRRRVQIQKDRSGKLEHHHD